MTWIGNDEHFTVLASAAIVWLAILLRRWITGPHRVPHRKLRALAARRKPATGTLAPCNAPVAGPEPQSAAAWITSRAGQASLNLRTTIQVWPPKPELIRAVGHLQGDVPTTARRGSDATTSVEPHPATGLPGTGPVAGPDLQAGDGCLDRDSVALPSRDESQPALRNSLLGAGLEPRIAAETPDSGGGPGHTRSAA